MDSLERLTRELYDAYEKAKEWKKRLDGDPKTKKNRETGFKEAFFAAATEAMAQAPLAQKTEVVAARDAVDAEKEAQRRNPCWNVKTVKTQYEGDPETVYLVLLEENPEFKEFSYTNKTLKKTFTKQIAAGTPEVDSDKLKSRDPDLWERITVPARELRPLEDLTPDDLAALQEYIYPGKPQIKLAQPRKAKPEELNEDDDKP